MMYSPPFFLDFPPEVKPVPYFVTGLLQGSRRPSLVWLASCINLKQSHYTQRCGRRSDTGHKSQSWKDHQRSGAIQLLLSHERWKHPGISIG